MKWIKTLLNIRTLGILAIGLASCFLAIRYQIKVHNNMVLFGLIISFPLVFSLQSAFKRREKALEYLALFKAGLSAVKESFQISKKLTEPNREIIRQVIVRANLEFFTYLEKGIKKQHDVYQNFIQITDFMFAHKEEMSSKAMFRITRYMKDVYNSVSYLMTLKTHRTVNVVRVFSNIFICLFPILQAGLLVDNFGKDLPEFVIYLISVSSAIILGTLLQIQRQLEDPFDQDGFDDIKLEEFGFNEKM